MANGGGEGNEKGKRRKGNKQVPKRRDFFTLHGQRVCLLFLLQRRVERDSPDDPFEADPRL